MEKITSSCIDHDVLGKRVYISRIDGDIITYDPRMVKPSYGAYPDNDGLHTFEHLFTTYVESSVYSDVAIYAEPMGCRTGFYFLTRNSISEAQTIQLVKDTMAFITGSEGDIPGTQESKECGNYLGHDLARAKAYAKAYGQVMRDQNEEQLVYPQQIGDFRLDWSEIFLLKESDI